VGVGVVWVGFGGFLGFVCCDIGPPPPPVSVRSGSKILFRFVNPRRLLSLRGEPRCAEAALTERRGQPITVAACL
jgi:hypothetical protein